MVYVKVNHFYFMEKKMNTIAQKIMNEIRERSEFENRQNKKLNIIICLITAFYVCFVGTESFDLFIKTSTLFLQNIIPSESLSQLILFLAWFSSGLGLIIFFYNNLIKRHGFK